MTSHEYKALREKLGLTQDGLASLLGVTRKTINARENGAKITEEAALAITALLLYAEATRETDSSPYDAMARACEGVEYRSFRVSAIQPQPEPQERSR